MLLRSLVVVGLVGVVSFAVDIAAADDAVAPTLSFAALNGVSFDDASARNTFAPAAPVDLSVDDQWEQRNYDFGATGGADRADPHGYEVALTAHRGSLGLPVDVSVAQHGSIGVTDQGDIFNQRRGSELRLGRGLGSMRRWRNPGWDHHAWYLFAASDDEAVTWRPGFTGDGVPSGFALQDRVEVGDAQAGVTYQVGPLQASLAYVERKISTRRGSQSWSTSEEFTGVTLTMRH